MSKDTIKVNMNVYDIPIVVEQLKKLEQENKQLKVKSEVLEENNKLLIQQKQQMYEDLDIAYEKIDKAIEYITTEQLYTNYQWGKSQYAKILKDLLAILGGNNGEIN